MHPTVHVPPDAILTALSVRGLLYLVDIVCARRGVTPEQLCGRARSHTVVTARHELWWLIRHHPWHYYSSRDIGRLVHRDHASILHGIAAHQRRLPPSG